MRTSVADVALRLGAITTEQLTSTGLYVLLRDGYAVEMTLIEN